MIIPQNFLMVVCFAYNINTINSIGAPILIIVDND